MAEIFGYMPLPIMGRYQGNPASRAKIETQVRQIEEARAHVRCTAAIAADDMLSNDTRRLDAAVKKMQFVAAELARDATRCVQVWQLWVKARKVK